MKTLVLGWNLLKPKNSNVEKDLTPQQLSSQNLGLMMTRKVQNTVAMSPEDAERLMEIDPYDLTSLANVVYLSHGGRCERGGFEYVAGYIAKKLMKINPELASVPTISETQTGWLHLLSKRGLTSPSDIWLTTCLKLEEYFTAFHSMRYIPGTGTSLNRSPQVLTTLINYLTAVFPDIPERAIKYFVRVRTMIRIKYINKKIQDQKRKFRALKRQSWLNGKDKDPHPAEGNEEPETGADDEYRFLLESEEDFSPEPPPDGEIDIISDMCA